MVMKQNIEIEYKSLLSPIDFNRLKKTFFKDAPCIIQENNYYDTIENSLFSNKVVPRIRILNNTKLFTLKQVLSSNEILEHEISDDNLQIDDPRITKLLNELNLPTELICVSKSITHRYLIKDEFGEWCLDLNEFDTAVDFELEYELFDSNSNELKRFLDLLETYGIPFYKADSKVVRSLKYANKGELKLGTELKTT